MARFMKEDKIIRHEPFNGCAHRPVAEVINTSPYIRVRILNMPDIKYFICINPDLWELCGKEDAARMVNRLLVTHGEI